MVPTLLSLVGGLIVFSSWVAQMTLYDRWKDKKDLLDKAESIYIVTLSGVFVIQAGSERVAFWKKEVFRLGLSYMIRGLPTKARANWEERLGKIEDDGMNEFGSQLMTYITERMVSLEKWKARFQWLFIALYILGSVLLILGQYVELGGSHAAAQKS